jgi:hypothetical protein
MTLFRRYMVAMVVLTLAGLLMAFQPAVAQQPTSLTTKSGLVVEEVRVGSSCVVVVLRGAGPGVSTMVAVPCQ